MGYGNKHPLQRALFSLLAAGLFLTCMITWSSAASFPGDSKVAKASLIDAAAKGDVQDLIVVIDETAAVTKAASMRKAAGVSHDTAEIVNAKSSLYRSMKAEALSVFTTQEVEPLKDYKRLPAMFLKVKSLAGLQKLAAQPGVKGIYPNRAMKRFLTESLPLINQPAAAAAGKIGTGTAVAVLDTGVNYGHADFGTCGVPGDCLSLPAPVAGCRVACVHDFAVDDASTDDVGHGTNVSAIVSGVAPGTNILGLDIFTFEDPDWVAYDADILLAIDWVLENKAAYNITAVNMSLGVPDFGSTTPCPSDVLALPVAELRAAGILSTVASGNDGLTAGASSPACVPAAVSVGAVYDADLGEMDWGSCVDETTAPDQVTCFSNNSYYTTLLAPGAMITAGGFTFGGTSMAAAHVAGAIAVLKGDNAFPGESADAIVNRLVVSGIPITDMRDPVSPIVKPRLEMNGALTAPLRVINGTVMTLGGQPVKDVTITATGPITATATTDESGIFKITGLPAGTYIVTASKLNFSFRKSSETVTITDKNIALQFVVKTYSIKGNIMSLFKDKKKVMLSGIEVTISGCDVGWIVTTNIKGQYQLFDLPNCNYTVVPDKTLTSGHTFTPDSQAVTLFNKNVKKVNFTSP